MDQDPFDQLQVTTHGMANGGEAVARAADGRVVFVEGALPDERVTVAITAEKKRFLRAKAVEILDASPSRVDPPCPHVADGCGGCGLQYATPEAQRQLRLGMVRDALQRLGRIPDPLVELGPELPTDGYRTAMRAAVQGGRAGFRVAQSHDVVVVGSCLVSHPLVEEILVDGRFGAAHEVSIRVGVGTGERMVVVRPNAAEVTVRADVLVVGADQLAQKRAWIHEEVAGRRWRVGADSFFQTRPDGAEALVVEVGRAAGDPTGLRAIDAYGGVGLMSTALLGAERITLVERSASAVADARVNLADLPVKAIRVAVERWHPSNADLVVADPSRAGLGKAGVDVLASTGASRFVLVSCDAGALGRDAGLLVEAGYRLERSVLVDLFPHTPRVEVVSTFTR
ncbi:MAG: class I SAM-dependent RNA methyltransferase [Actinomycetia bacterium]|nr:class I SAM-dependent RNA methyltransferase [Actinomycetes bacterium]MCP4088060.1 class I SAM-dependent RNA methyltransferase [Actinomycetes bacterium]